MEIPLIHDKLVNLNISVRTAGILSGPKLLLNGEVVKGKRGVYTIKNASGEEIAVKIKNTIFDPIPKVLLNEEELTLARPLSWYEYVWMGLPLLLIFIGGVLGVLIGGMSTYFSGRIFRSDRSNLSKYLLTGCVSIAAVFTYIILVTILHILIYGPPE